MKHKVIKKIIVACRGRPYKNTIRQKLEPNLEGISNAVTTVQKDNYVLEIAQTEKEI